MSLQSKICAFYSLICHYFYLSLILLLDGKSRQQSNIQNISHDNTALLMVNLYKSSSWISFETEVPGSGNGFVISEEVFIASSLNLRL